MQTEIPRRGYAVGVQEFDTIRMKRAVYVDKTEYVWKMVSADAQTYFLSRPRRFGKTLLVSTLQAYFEGRKELFDGLAICGHETEWQQYPVVRINLSQGKYYELERVHSTIDNILREHEERWNVASIKDEYAYDVRLTNIIKAAYKETGKKVVILIDEYDAPMLDSVKEPELQNKIRDRVRNLFSPLKAQERNLRFVFLTGISKFSQLSVFSELNNLNTLTYNPTFEGVCGITQEELETQLRPDVERLAATMTLRYSKYGRQYDYDAMMNLLKHTYDGYHFSKEFTDVYNPWSLFSAFNEGDVSNYWFGTGTPSSLIDLLDTTLLYLPELENYRCNIDDFDAPTERISDPVPVLFQSGYLTLKDYDGLTDEYILGFPNEEVYRGFANSLYKYYCKDYSRGKNTIIGAYARFSMGQYSIDEFMQAIQQFFAAIPYSITDKNQNELFYQASLYNLLVAAGANVHAAQQTATGRMDISMKMTNAIYILELKFNHTVQKALSQIKEKDYAVAFASDLRPVYAVGMNFTSNSYTLDGWAIEQLR